MKTIDTKDMMIGRLPETGFIRQAQLIPFILPIGKVTLWRWCKSGKFPAPIRLSPRVSAWRAEDIRRWLAEQK